MFKDFVITIFLMIGFHIAYLYITKGSPCLDEDDYAEMIEEEHQQWAKESGYIKDPSLL